MFSILKNNFNFLHQHRFYKALICSKLHFYNTEIKDYIQNKTIEFAKKILFETDKSINEIAFELGFKYPQHFTRLLKKQVGQTPKE